VFDVFSYSYICGIAAQFMVKLAGHWIGALMKQVYNPITKGVPYPFLVAPYSVKPFLKPLSPSKVRIQVKLEMISKCGSLFSFVF
jgi:hypothetical protein